MVPERHEGDIRERMYASLQHWHHSYHCQMGQLSQEQCIVTCVPLQHLHVVVRFGMRANAGTTSNLTGGDGQACVQCCMKLLE